MQVMNMNKKAMNTSTIIISVILGLILLFITTNVFGGFADRGSQSFNTYYEFDDYDGDGIPSMLDPCPCDHKEDVLAVRYVLLGNLFNEKGKRGYELFKQPVSNITARDRSEIITFLSLRNIGLTDNELLLSEELKNKVSFSVNTPDTRLFCYNDKTGPNGMCSPGDFQRDYLQLQQDSISLISINTNYETICLTSKPVCDELIYKHYEYLKKNPYDPNNKNNVEEEQSSGEE
jgi:hypothetical protein